MWVKTSRKALSALAIRERQNENIPIAKIESEMMN